MSKKSALIRAIVVLLISIFVFTVLFVPALNMFSIQKGDVNESISIGQTLLLKNDFHAKDFAFRDFRAFFVSTTDGNVCIELLWYAMMLQYILGVLTMFGSLMMIVGRKLKTKRVGCNTAFFSSLALLLTQITIIVTIAVPASMAADVKLVETVVFNIPMLVVNVLASVAAIVLCTLNKKPYQEKKLSEGK